MKQRLLEGKYINDVTFKFGFLPILRIEKYMYALADELKSFFPDEVIDTKVPYDFDPSAPRFILRDVRKKRVLEVSLDSAIFKLELTNEYSKNIEKGLNYFQEKCREIIVKLSDIIEPTFDQIAGVFLIQYSLGTDFENPDAFFVNKFLNNQIPRPEVYKFQLAYIKNDKYYLNYSLSGFSAFSLTFDIKKEHQKNKLIKIDPMRHPGRAITDRGVQVQIDVNNNYFLRQSQADQTAVDPNETTDEIFEIVCKTNSGLEDFICG